MCGIFGMIKPDGRQSDIQLDIARRVMTSLSRESVIRGDDSTGLSIIGKNTIEMRSLVPSDILSELDVWNAYMNKIDRDTNICMGHVRLATTGAITLRNCHPFKVGNIIGAHNGCIYNWRKYAKTKDMECDSEAIFASLYKNKDIKKSLEGLEGDFAISWYDGDKFHLSKDGSRPLVTAYWRKPKILFWASTSEIMQDALISSGLQIKINQFPDNKVRTYNLEEFNNKQSYSEIEIEPSDSYSYSSAYGYYYGSSVGDNHCLACGDKFDKSGLCQYCDYSYGCSDCGAVGYSYEFEEIGGKYVCDKCSEKYTFMCYSCLEYNSYSENEQYLNKSYCRDCYAAIDWREHGSNKNLLIPHKSK